MRHLGDITKINGKGTARWASEIEKDAVAVTRYHFEEET